MFKLEYLQKVDMDTISNRVNQKARAASTSKRMEYSVSESVDVCKNLLADIKDGNVQAQNAFVFHPDFNLNESLSMDELEDFKEFMNSFTQLNITMPDGQNVIIKKYQYGDYLGLETNGRVIYQYDKNTGDLGPGSEGFVRSESGKAIPLRDVFSHLAQSIQETEILTHALDLATTNQANSAAFLASLSMWKGSLTAKSLELSDQLASVMNYNDPRGVIQLIANYLTPFSKPTDNGDGTLTLSSIDWKVETGLVITISGVISTVSQIVGAIAAFFNVAVGFLISTVGNLVSGIINADKSDATYPEFNTMASSPTLAVPIFQSRKSIDLGIGPKVADLGYVRYHTLGMVCHAWVDPTDSNYFYSEGFLDLRYNVIPNKATGCCGVSITVTDEDTTIRIPAHEWITNGVNFDGDYSYPSGYYDGKKMPYNQDITGRVLSALLFTMIGLLDPFTAYYYNDDGEDTEIPISNIVYTFNTYSQEPDNVEKWIRTLSYFLTRLYVGETQTVIDEIWPMIVNTWIPLIRDGYNTQKPSGFTSINTVSGVVSFDEWISTLLGNRGSALAEYPITHPHCSLTHFVKPAIQSASSWLASAILSSAVVVAAAVAVAVTVFKVRKSVTSFLNRKGLEVKRAEYEYMQNPSSYTLTQYNKAIRKQSLWQSALGRANPSSINGDSMSADMKTDDASLLEDVNNVNAKVTQLEESISIIRRLIKLD